MASNEQERQVDHAKLLEDLKAFHRTSINHKGDLEAINSAKEGEKWIISDAEDRAIKIVITLLEDIV